MVSIIIPAYNAERTIERCLESIFMQAHLPERIVVIDDASTDKTWSMLNSWKTDPEIGNLANGDSPITFTTVRTPSNQGANAARNRGWREVQQHHSPPPSSSPTRGEESDGNFPPLMGGVRGGGHYVLFCDADIVLRPDCLEKMVRALEEHPEAAYAYSSFKFGWKKFKLWPFDAKRLREMPYIHTTSLIRASAIYRGSTSGSVPEVEPRVSRPFDESITRLQDWDLWLTMLEQGHTGVWIPEVLFRVINPKGTMSQWLPSFAYKLPKWLRLQSKAVLRYNEAVARIKQKHHLV